MAALGSLARGDLATGMQSQILSPNFTAASSAAAAVVAVSVTSPLLGSSRGLTSGHVAARRSAADAALTCLEEAHLERARDVQDRNIHHNLSTVTTLGRDIIVPQRDTRIYSERDELVWSATTIQSVLALCPDAIHYEGNICKALQRLDEHNTPGRGTPRGRVFDTLLACESMFAHTSLTKRDEKNQFDSLWVTVIKVQVPVPGHALRFKKHIIVRFASHGRCCGDERFVLATVRQNVKNTIPVHAICVGNDSGVAFFDSLGHTAGKLIRAPLTLRSTGLNGCDKHLKELERLPCVLGGFVLDKTSQSSAFLRALEPQASANPEVAKSMHELALRLFTGRDVNAGISLPLLENLKASHFGLIPWTNVTKHPLVLGAKHSGASRKLDLSEQLALFACFPRILSYYSTTDSYVTREAIRYNRLSDRRPKKMDHFLPLMRVMVGVVTMKQPLSEVAVDVSKFMLATKASALGTARTVGRHILLCHGHCNALFDCYTCLAVILNQF